MTQYTLKVNMNIRSVIVACYKALFALVFLSVILLCFNRNIKINFSINDLVAVNWIFMMTVHYLSSIKKLFFVGRIEYPAMLFPPKIKQKSSTLLIFHLKAMNTFALLLVV